MPGFRVSRAARDDIREIGLYTQKTWGVAQRRRYLARLNERFGVLAENPRLAAERPEFTPPVRILRFQSHLIVYLAEEGGILIVRVLHESMDVAAHL